MLVVLSENIALVNREAFFVELRKRIQLFYAEVREEEFSVKRLAFMLDCDLIDFPVYHERLTCLRQELSQPERVRLEIVIQGVDYTFELEMEPIHLVAHLVQ